MARTFQLPSITKLEEVLELLTDPQKYADMLSELKSIYDETQSALGDIAAKGEADAFLAQAAQKHQDAVSYADKVSKDSATVLANVSAAEAVLKQDKEAFDHYKTHSEGVIQIKEKELRSLQAEFANYKSESEKALQIDRDTLASAFSKLRAEQDASAALKAKLQKALE
jgi:hypothetical protein